MMSREVREEEIYEDLTMILQLVKKKLNSVIHHPLHEQRLHSQEEEQSDNLLNGFRAKYAHITHVSAMITKVTERFFCRIKEIINQLYFKVSRQRLDLLRFFRETQQFIGKPLNFYNPQAIVSFLDAAMLLGNSKQQVKQTFGVRPRQKKHQQKTDEKEINVRQSHQPLEGEKRISEVQLMQKNAEHYRVMDVDSDHIRARYFDLKSGQKVNIVSDMLFRNRFIKQIMKEYQLQYEKFKRKQPNNGSKRIFCRFRRRQERWELLESLCQSDNRIDTVDSTTFNRTSRGKSEQDKRRRGLNASSHIIQRRNRQNKMTIDSFRNLFEQKLNEKKENIKIRNVVINLHGSEGGIKDKGPNQKRIQFYKKSQDQVRLRYKYYNYSYKSANTSKSSIKYRTINPQSTFNTIDA